MNVSHLVQQSGVEASVALTCVSERLHRYVRNDAAPLIIVVAIGVLLALGATIVAGAVVLCARNGGVLDGVVSLSAWEAKVTCHKL